MIILRNKNFSSKSNKKENNKDDDEKAKRKKKRDKIILTSLGAIGGTMMGVNAGSHFIDNPYCRKCEPDAWDNYACSNKKGSIIGGVLGATGGIRAARASKKTIERLRNSQDKKKAKDKVKVARGEMTESEFVEKHGGKEK